MSVPVISPDSARVLVSLPGPAAAPASPSQTLAVANRLCAVPLTDRALAATGARKMGAPFVPQLPRATTETEVCLAG